MPSDDLAPRVVEAVELARAHYAAGQYREALAAARDAFGLLDAARRHEHFGLPALPWCLAAAVAAECLVQLGDPTGARDELRRGREPVDTAGDVPSRLLLDTAEADVLIDTGRAADAIQLLEPAVATACHDVETTTLAHALATLAAAYASAGRHADARAASAEALAVIDQADAAMDHARPHITTAHAALGLGEIERAEEAYATAVEIAQARDERGNEGWAHFAGGLIALERGDRAAAEQRLEAADDIAEELGMMRLVERCRAALRRAR